MKIGSLFSGYGGLDMAAASAFGATTAWVSDVDKGACKILAHRYPDISNIGDITTVDWSTVEPGDIITGGSPCQDLSHAGRRAGMTEGTRSNLWVAMREAIAQLQPTYVIWENVRGAYSAAADSGVEPCAGCVGDGSGVHLRALGRVLGDLSDLGYDCQWRGLRAADVGAPHGRFRVFVVGRLADSERGHEDVTLLPTPTADNSRGLPSAGTDYQSLPNAVCALLPTPTCRDHKDHEIAPAKHRPDDTSNLTRAFALLPTPAVNDMGKAYTPDDGLGRRIQDFGQYADAIARWEVVIGRPAPAPTEPTGRNGAHRLSPRFTEWMMGLPAGWITDVPGITRNEALKACGNGVVPQQAYAAITDALEAFARIGAAA